MALLPPRLIRMLLYKEKFIPHILGEVDPLKVTTRRLGNRRWNVGAIHTFKTNYYSDSAFAKGKILNVYWQNLFDMTDDDAFREGFWSLEDFKKTWININGNWTNTGVWVVDFRVVENLLAPKKERKISDFFTMKC